MLAAAAAPDELTESERRMSIFVSMASPSTTSGSQQRMRLFIAVNFPLRLRDRILRMTRSLRASDLPMRWVGRDGLHLTLKFLGEVRSATVDALEETLAGVAVSFRPFPLRFERIGAFPSLRHPRVIWLGAEPTPEIRFLKQDLERAFGEFGIRPEQRPYQPHVTLGRALRSGEAGTFRALEGMARESFLPLEYRVTHIDLMRSRLSPAGATYTLLKAARLGARNR